MARTHIEATGLEVCTPERGSLRDGPLRSGAAFQRLHLGRDLPIPGSSLHAPLCFQDYLISLEMSSYEYH
jgi:hypothetical protein